jgi:hypothetical protein
VTTADLFGNPLDATGAAKAYFREGYIPIRVPPREKGPRNKDWQRTRYSDEEELDNVFPFDKPHNIGLLLGVGPAVRLLDVDLDSREARALASRFLPPTQRISGRKSAPKSHYWYHAAGDCGGRKEFKDPAADKDATLVELRGNGGQTIVPPSVHCSGELYQWDAFAEAGVVEYDVLLRAVSDLAAAALLARHWPGAESHKRQDTAMALAGGLLRSWSPQQTASFLDAVCTAAGDPDVRQRVSVVNAASLRLAAKEAVVGWPRLAELSGDKIVTKAREWLGLRDGGPEKAHEGNGRCSPDGADNDGQKPKPPSAASRMVELALAAGAELTRTPDGKAFMTVTREGRRETWPIRSRDARSFLRLAYYAAVGRSAGGQAVEDACGTLEGMALCQGAERPVHVRLAGDSERVYLDLADVERRLVEVDRRGWRVVTDPPVLFRRPRGLLALPLPERGGGLSALRRLLNLEAERDWYLAVAWMVAALRPQGPYPVLCVHGEQGAAKSTTARMARSPIDPSAAPLRSEPRDGRDVMIAATNGWIVALDNLSSIQPWLSDCLCRLATGGGYATRELYSDNEEVILDAQRPVILTSIEDLATRGDLLDRAIVLTLPAIPEDRRRPEKELWAEYEQARPGLLGALLDALAGALARLPGVRLDRLPRMADFALLGVAVERTLNWPQGAFLDAYRDNRQTAHNIALESSPIVGPLRALAAEGAWTGTAAELLGELAGRAGEKATRGRDWPSSARTLSGRLRRLAPNLLAVGVTVTFEPRRRDGSRPIHISQT